MDGWITDTPTSERFPIYTRGNADEVGPHPYSPLGWSLTWEQDPPGRRLMQEHPEIWSLPDNEDPIYDGPKVPASESAQGILDAIESETFEHYLPDLKAIVEAKTAAIDQFIAGSAAMERAPDRASARVARP